MYHPPSVGQNLRYTTIRVAARVLAAHIATMCPPSADRTTAIRAVREAVMWANASIVLKGSV